MADELKNYPPVGSDERFESIRSRGRFLRRRRQVALSSGVGGVLLVALVAVAVLLPGTNNGSSEQVVADGGDGTNAEQTTTTEAMPENMTATFSVNDGVLNIEVADPLMPQPVSGQLSADSIYDVQQCALVIIRDASGNAIAEGSGCNPASADDNSDSSDTTHPLELRPTTENLLIGCAARVSREGAGEYREVPHRSSLRSDLPSDMAPGSYTITIAATSGIGDGCPAEGDSGSTTDSGTQRTEAENVVTVDGSFKIPS